MISFVLKRRCDYTLDILVLLFNYLDVVVNEKFELRVIISYLNLWVDQEANIAFWNSA